MLQQEEHMTRWIAAIADQVNNPVAGMSAALSIAERELYARQATGACREDLLLDSMRRLRERLDQLGEYVSELLNVVRPTSANLRPLSTALVLQEVLADMPKFAEFETYVAQEAGSISADPTLLRTALKCLVRNGVEAVSGLFGPTAKVSLRVTRNPQGSVVFEVHDNGPGFSEEALKGKNEAFFSTKEAGTGLGLAIARRLAETHGGQLKISRSSTLGGAKVELDLGCEASILPGLDRGFT